MKDALILEDKIYISARRAAEISGYASDYVGQLCRAGKLVCKMVGRSWFVTEESLVKHCASTDQPLKEQIISLPVIPEKKLDIQIQEKNIINETVSFVPQIFALPNTIPFSFVEAPYLEKHNPLIFTSFAKFGATAYIALIALAFLFQSSLINFNIPEFSIPNIHIDQTASIISNTISNARSSFTKIFSFISDFNKNKLPEVSPQFNGLAVVPSTNSATQDELVKQKIKDSFTDEVVVKPDASGTSGVITPVFKKVTGDNFVYVLVPINQKYEK